MKPNWWREVLLITGCFAFGCLIVGMIELYKNFDFEIKKVTQEKVPAVERVPAVEKVSAVEKVPTVEKVPAEEKVAEKDKVIEVEVISLAELPERVTDEIKITEKSPPPPAKSNLVIKPTRKDLHLDLHLSDCKTGQILVYTEQKGAHCIRDIVLPGLIVGIDEEVHSN
jgi:hypothetical protein